VIVLPMSKRAASSTVLPKITFRHINVFGFVLNTSIAYMKRRKDDPCVYSVQALLVSLSAVCI